MLIVLDSFPFHPNQIHTLLSDMAVLFGKHKSLRGFHITLYDANIIEGDDVIGRAWIGPLEAASMIESGEAQ
eukprot:10772230-Ditylum_brightwellii.AAC.1